MYCCTSALRDIKTLSQRIEHEGESFLTICLPNFGKDFERGLDQGFVDCDMFAGFGRHAGLPRFLGGFLSQVFDRTTGVLFEVPSVEAIRAIRQLTLMFGKVALPCAPHRVRKALEDYLECEQEVKVTSSRLASIPIELEDLQRVGKLLFGDVFAEVERKLVRGDYLPKHGPGATADYLVGNEKYEQNAWPYRLEQYFPFLENVVHNWSLTTISDQLDGVDFLEPGRELPVRVVTVPKTLKTPRIIAIEPTAMMYAQQAIMRLFVDAVKEFDPSSRIVGFDDQIPNQEMAREGSLSGDLATLDLSEASDRVSTLHVRALLHDYPYLLGAVMACRSRKAWIKDLGVTIPLSKFASMGSALTFPIEAMVFATTCFVGIEQELNTRLNRRTVHRYKRQVRVYGDDIVVPRDYVLSVVQSLEALGFKVNLGKSFWTGRFRESCGKEYYEGEDVSIVRLRRLLPSQRTDAAGIIAAVAFRNQLYFAGYWRTVQWLDDELVRVMKYFPTVLPTSPALGRHSFLGFEIQREDEYLHKPLVRAWRVRSPLPQNPLRDERALTKCLLMLESRERSGHDYTHMDIGEPLGAGEDHLERSGRPQFVNIKLGWCSAV
jgi:hypothetical protein